MYRNQGKEMGVAHYTIKTINWLKEICFCPYSLDQLGSPSDQRMNASLREVSHSSDKIEAETVILGSSSIESTAEEKAVYQLYLEKTGSLLHNRDSEVSFSNHYNSLWYFLILPEWESQ